ncbi:hypothetical protein C8F04DRAFT_1177948 [Mycena alexandri]|uniref:Uncharacterized protein n=1 Tax=Mycena alexandri TaxID=1745969 RepID=A0AAD6X9S1_9AGAR|nr:hypothetical protein C8F04DRAFT_1177948 [Mycena alexandri]
MALMLRMAAEQRGGSNMTTYTPNAPNQPELASIAYPVDGDGHPIAPERLEVHAQTHNFALPACFHRLSVDVSLQTGENTSTTIALTCPVQPAEEKCPFSINLSSLIAEDSGMNYERYAAKIPDATKDKDSFLRDYLSRSLSPLNAPEDDAVSLDAQFEDPSSYASLNDHFETPPDYATDDGLYSRDDELHLPSPGTRSEGGRRPNIDLPQTEDNHLFSEVPEPAFPTSHLGRYSALWYRVPVSNRSVSAPPLPPQSHSRSSTPDSLPDLVSVYHAPGDYHTIASPVPPPVSPISDSRISTPDSLPDLISIYSRSSSEVSLPDIAYFTDHSSSEDVSSSPQCRGAGRVILGEGKVALVRLTDDFRANAPSTRLTKWKLEASSLCLTRTGRIAAIEIKSLIQIEVFFLKQKIVDGRTVTAVLGGSALYEEEGSFYSTRNHLFAIFVAGCAYETDISPPSIALWEKHNAKSLHESSYMQFLSLEESPQQKLRRNSKYKRQKRHDGGAESQSEAVSEAQHETLLEDDDFEDLDEDSAGGDFLDADLARAFTIQEGSVWGSSGEALARSDTDVVADNSDSFADTILQGIGGTSEDDIAAWIGAINNFDPTAVPLGIGIGNDWQDAGWSLTDYLADTSDSSVAWLPKLTTDFDDLEYARLYPGTQPAEYQVPIDMLFGMLGPAPNELGLNHFSGTVEDAFDIFRPGNDLAESAYAGESMFFDQMMNVSGSASDADTAHATGGWDNYGLYDGDPETSKGQIEKLSASEIDPKLLALFG